MSRVPGKTGARTSGDVHDDIWRRRSAVSVKVLRERLARGEELPPTTRALTRLSVGATRIMLDLEDLTEWDDEEIAHGQRRDRRGKFPGPPPKILPRALHDEMVRRTLSKAQELMRENLVKAVEALTQIATDDLADEKDRLKAIELIMNRVMGKEPQKVEVTAQAKWELALASAIVPLPEALETPAGEDEPDDYDG